MSCFVLVHGAFHGGWCWRRVAPLLRAQGHEVHVLSPGAHGSSTLVADRVGADVSQAWALVLDFLDRVRAR